jgi:hypothetical protein
MKYFAIISCIFKKQFTNFNFFVDKISGNSALLSASKVWFAVGDLNGIAV